MKDFWIIITKLILLLYLIIEHSVSEIGDASWFVLMLLIYFCINIAIDIFQNKNLKAALHLAAIVLMAACQYYIYPSMIILLPLNAFELAALYIKGRIPVLFVMLFPIFFLGAKEIALYIAVLFLGYIIFTAVDLYSARIQTLEDHLDAMRKRVAKLVNQLNNNEVYLRQSEYTYKLEERNRISQEIHDQIGHAMTSALIQMEASKKMLESGNGTAAKALLENAIMISKSGIDQIRNTLKNLKPAKEQIGIHRLKLLTGEFSSKHGISVPVTYKGNLDVITPLQWKVLYENAHESLTNVLKYAHATMVSIDIRVYNKIIKMEIKDNGQGATKIKRGLGMIGMEERTAALGGNIIVDGSGGFMVSTLLPISE